MSAIPDMPTWFPEGKVDPQKVLTLSTFFLRSARDSGFTREEYAMAVAQSAEALCLPEQDDSVDSDVKRFVSERLMASAIGLAGGTQ